MKTSNNIEWVGNAALYIVVTESIDENQVTVSNEYSILATSVKEAIEIVNISNEPTGREEEVIKAWRASHITGGVSPYGVAIDKSIKDLSLIFQK